MKKMLSHEGYKGSVDFDLDNNILHGKILFISDLVTYEADDINGLKSAFVEAVEDYVADCLEDGVSPQKSCSGTMQIRMGAELHSAVEQTAYQSGLSANKWIVGLIEKCLSGESVIQEVHNHEHKHFHQRTVVPVKDNLDVWGSEESVVNMAQFVQNRGAH